jgi:hypothetical protein
MTEGRSVDETLLEKSAVSARAARRIEVTQLEQG